MLLLYNCSDVNNARTLKAKAKAMAIPMQRLTMKYEVMKSFFPVLLQGYKYSLITSFITDMLRRNE